MNNFNRGSFDVVQQPPVTGTAIEFRPLMRMVYLWMSLGLLVTAVVAMFTANSEALLNLIFGSGWTVLGLVVVQFVLVIALTAGLQRMSPGLAAGLFFVYSAVTGLTFSSIFLVYELGSISAAFITTAGLFGAMTLVGFTTKTDLSKYSTYFMMGLIGLVIAMVVNMFLQSGPFDFLISIVGVILFTGLTAWDTQKLKNMSMAPELQDNNDMTMRLSVMGALMLYLDFINLFLFLLRLFGGGRD